MRPPAATSDDRSRVTQAAINVADTFSRFDRDLQRLQRALADGRRAGLSDDDLAAAVNAATLGRDDRRRALDAVFPRLAEGDVRPRSA